MFSRKCYAMLLLVWLPSRKETSKKRRERLIMSAIRAPLFRFSSALDPIPSLGNNSQQRWAACQSSDGILSALAHDQSPFPCLNSLNSLSSLNREMESKREGLILSLSCSNNNESLSVFLSFFPRNRDYRDYRDWSGVLSYVSWCRHRQSSLLHLLFFTLAERWRQRTSQRTSSTFPEVPTEEGEDEEGIQKYLYLGWGVKYRKDQVYPDKKKETTSSTLWLEEDLIFTLSTKYYFSPKLSVRTKNSRAGVKNKQNEPSTHQSKDDDVSGQRTSGVLHELASFSLSPLLLMVTW